MTMNVAQLPPMPAATLAAPDRSGTQSLRSDRCRSARKHRISRLHRAAVATTYAVAKGLAGVVVQGCVRDIDNVAAMGFPVWATNIWPVHADKGKGGGVNLPIACADVVVRPGDLVVADGDGVIVIPRSEAATVVSAARVKMNKEAEFAAAIRAGSSAWELTGASKVYENLGLVERDAAFDDGSPVAAA